MSDEQNKLMNKQEQRYRYVGQPDNYQRGYLAAWMKEGEGIKKENMTQTQTTMCCQPEGEWRWEIGGGEQKGRKKEQKDTLLGTISA